MPLVEDAQGLAELPQNELPAPQLVMLANVACENPTEGKEMMELQTVGSSSYSDSEDENIIRYNYPESPREEGLDLSKPSEKRPSSPPTPFTPSTPLGMIMESAKKKKPFFCKPCNYQAQREEEFVTHIQIHSANRMIVVKRVEGDKARAKETLAGPDQEAESGDGGANNKGVIRCERCGYNTNRYDHYMAHLKHHEKEGDDQRVYKCTICTYTTVSQYHWRKHLRNHFPSKLFTCNQCCYFSDRKNNYVQHIRTHTGERPFRCPYCEYSSSQKTHLTRHMRTHSGERPFKCDRCNYLAANQHEVTRHSRQVHNGPKPLCCPHCPYKTADRSNYKKHVELHLNPRQFLCPVCKYAASKKCNLQYHIKSRHPGCPQIAMDVSKVKLRVKKPDSDEFADEYTIDMEERPEISGADKQSSHINLSTKKSSNPVPLQAAESVATDKTHKKCYMLERENMEKVKEENKKLEKEKKEQLGTLKNEREGKENKNTTKSKKSPSKKIKKVVDKTVAKAPQSLDAPVEKQGEKSRTKPLKRKAAEALDLSMKESPEEPCTNIKAKRLKIKAVSEQENPANQIMNSPVKKSNKTEASYEETEASSENKGCSIIENPISLPENKKGPATKLQPTVLQGEQKASDQETVPAMHTSTSQDTTPQAEQATVADHSEETPTPEDESPSPTEIDGSPDFRRPQGEPSTPTTPSLELPRPRGKPTETEEDEGIHSHDGGSEISDSASEGSDDSGLNGLAAAAGKLANDPETPTEEIPTPTELKSHMCIFCDRTFPLEVEYRRHLNRHLVNVYYLDNASKLDQ
ncbi:unnamed protein product [Oncorhynchus mykiss]|uniref:C2H2-type domain-containing protein n=1 Tax=Oncorhynchus mykiss TaxID=8022 RepID=A0A060W1W3_ONCMY|nr:unnamed protein product [Oncorhynchus mykiss]